MLDAFHFFFFFISCKFLSNTIVLAEMDSKTHFKMGPKWCSRDAWSCFPRTQWCFRSCVSPGQGHTSNKCKWMEVLFKPSMQPISLCGSCQNHVNWPFSLLAFPYWVSAHQKLCRSWSLCCQKSPGTFWHEGMLAPGSGSVVCSPMLFPNLSICCIEHELLSPWTQHESNRWHLLNVFTRTSSNSHFYVF